MSDSDGYRCRYYFGSGHLVYSHQLVDRVERVKDVSGEPVKVRCADIPFEFEGS